MGGEALPPLLNALPWLPPAQFPQSNFLSHCLGLLSGESKA